MSRVREIYENEIVEQMMKKFGYKNKLQVPRIEKVVINMGVGEAKDNPKVLESAVNDLTIISDKNQLLQRLKNLLRHLKFVKACQ